jgi:TonB-dependent SusC/RagA subfamily outer membrane receptor
MRMRSCPYRPRTALFAGLLAIGALLFLVLPAVPAAGLSALAQQTRSTITGQVVDSATKESIPGVAITSDGTRLSALTGQDGHYRIASVPAGTYTLVARRIGYAPQRHTVTSDGQNELVVDFSLQAAATSLSEIIVTGTGQAQERREIPNAVSTVDATDVLSKSQAPDLGTLLNSRAPGVTISPNTGRLGAGPQINIRGIASLGLDNNPLIYIDGVRVSNATGGGPTSFGNGGFGGQNAGIVGRLNDISPEEIESIQIIKGPAASTIYGTEAANGVIQIITKKGAGVKPTLSVQVQQGGVYFRNPEGRVATNLFPDSTGALVAFNGVSAEERLGTPIFKTGQTQQFNASLSGALGATNYYVSTNFQDDHGVEPNNKIRQFSGHANLNMTPSPKYDVGTSLNYVQGTYHLGADVGLSPLLGAEFGHPLIFSAPGADGFYPNVPPSVPQTLFDNSDGINRFTGSATVHHQPISWFNERLVAGVDYTGEDGRGLELFAPPELAPFTLGNAAGRIGQTLARRTVTSLDYSGTAKFDLTPKWSSATSLGGQWYRTSLQESFLGGIGFPGPGITTVSGTAQALPATQADTTNTTVGGYAQEEIGLNNRLFITAALRVDNNSSFGSDFKWITYPKIGASWIVDEEPFWHVAFVNSLKLRAAFGESGRAPLAFSALRAYQPVQGPGGTNAFTAGAFGNANLKPERGKETEVGFESDLFNRLHVDVTYYNKHTTNEIVAQTIAPSVGFFGTQFQNLGQVNNHGFEFLANLQVLRRQNFAWEISGNFATMNNKIISLGNVPSVVTSSGQFNVVGYPIQSYFSKRVVSATLDKSGAATNVLCDGGAGQAPMSCDLAPFVYAGTPTPTSTGSIGNSFTLYKRLRLYALFDWKRGNSLNNAVEQVRCDGLLGAGLCDVNYHPTKYSATYVAEASFTGFVTQTQDQFFEDASFLKLREVSATYTLPDRLIPGFQHASFTLAARELGLWTHYRGPDPEVNASPSGLTLFDQAVIPPLSRIVATLNLTF